MGTSVKSILYAFPTLASLANNTQTNLTQITINLPESSKTFRSVIAKISCDDIVTATGGSITTKTFDLRLGAAAYTSVANANALTNSGENLSLFWTVDFTSHFTTNWSGTSQTCDFRLQLNQSTGTTLGMVNVSVILYITYEYDDTSATQIKSVMIPLDAPTGALSTSATTYDTFPALDTYLPEASKTYRNMFIVVQGNEHRAGATTDHTMTINLGSSTVTTGNYEGALASDRWYRYVWNLTDAGFTDTANTQNFQLSATVARCHHPQAYAVITYEYSESSTSSVMNSMMIPVNMLSPMGGTTSSDYRRLLTDIWIQEPGTITTNRLSFFSFWTQTASTDGVAMRIGAGSFTSAFTDAASVLCGGNGAMHRNDSAFTLARGLNTLNFDIYRTDATDIGWGICGFWIINYTSSKSSKGTGAHNHTVWYPVSSFGTAAAVQNVESSAVAPPIPNTDYFLNQVGIECWYMQNSSTAPISALMIYAEKTSGEGGIEWFPIYVDGSALDNECGMMAAYGDCRRFFKRWPGDPDPTRLDIETSRRWQWWVSIFPTFNQTGWRHIDLVINLHSITYAAADSISGFTGTTSLALHRSDAATFNPGEKVQTSSRSGDGSFSFTWYDNTVATYVTAYDGTHPGRSQDTTAAGSP